MERLANGEALSPGPLLMHSLVWGPRAGHKNFNRWLKDCLVKQVSGIVTTSILKLVQFLLVILNEGFMLFV